MTTYKQTVLVPGKVLHREYPPCKRSVSMEDMGFYFFEFPYLNFILRNTSKNVFKLHVAIRDKPISCDDDALYEPPIPNCTMRLEVCLNFPCIARDLNATFDAAINAFWETDFTNAPLNRCHPNEIFNFSKKSNFITCLKDFIYDKPTRFYYEGKLYELYYEGKLYEHSSHFPMYFYLHSDVSKIYKNGYILSSPAVELKGLIKSADFKPREIACAKLVK